MMKFRQIPTAGRVIIVAVAIGVLAIALVACWTSYNAIYRLVAALDLYGAKTNSMFPLLVDAAFLVAELAAILGAIMRTVTRSEEVSPGWPVFTMIICGVCTIAFNMAHAYLVGAGGWSDPLTKYRCMVAALPPLLMILSFQVLIAIVKWVMLRLGRPEQAFGGVGFGGYGAGTFPPQGAFGQMPMSAYTANGQNGQPGWGSGVGTKREVVEAFRARPGNGNLTAREISADLAEEGYEVSERYVADILGGRSAGRRNGHRKP